MTDDELVAKTIAGDTQAYRALVERYQAALLRYARYLVHDADGAEDVVQDSLIKAYRNLRSYQPGRQFSSWMYRIVHNTAMDSLKHPVVSLDEDLASQLPANNVAPQDLFDEQIQAQDVAACLHKLPVKYREPVMLFYFEDRSYQDISDILRISLSAVGVRINRAKHQLKQICRHQGAHV